MAPRSPAAPVSSVEPFVPIPVADLELTVAGPAPEPNARGQLMVVVRVHGAPVGVLALVEPGAAAVDLRALAVERFGPAVEAHLEADGFGTAVDPGAVGKVAAACPQAPVPGDRRVTVAVCTLGEDPRLVQTVESILAQTHTALELLVVDNQPNLARASALLAGVDDPRLRVVPQPRRGLSAARNAAVAAATGELIAFTDDDAYADRDWVASLVAPFAADPAVVCTTGLVLPAELATAAQVWFEEFGAFDKGFDPVVWSAGPAPTAARALGRRGEGGILFPYSAGVYGSGNNMAFRLDWLRGQKLFDEALGAGTLSRGGEDLDAFLTVILEGQVLVYEPRAVVRHFARSDLSGLQTQMYGYGSGMAALIVKQVLSRPRSVARIATRVPAGLRRLLDPGSEKNAAKTAAFPAELGRAELRGYVAGPALYLRSAARARRSRPTMPPAVR